MGILREYYLSLIKDPNQNLPNFVPTLATERLDLDDADSDDSEMSNSAKGARNIAEWRFIARILDRLLLLIFALLLLILGLLSMVMAEEKLVIPNV